MRCHYEVLGVERNADAEELKRAYRRMALLHHPDKNPHRAEEATIIFKEVQAAYEILNDPQERSWYDSHREQILRGGDGLRRDEQGGDESENLMSFFSPSCFNGYGDDEKGFYTVYARVFDDLAHQENHSDDFDASSSAKGKRLDEDDLPPFGKSDAAKEDVTAFYGHWAAFSTKKSFAWHDKYDTREAPNRQVRRMIEKDNNKERETARKKYNEVVRTLVDYVRKRDKRYIAIQAQIAQDREKRQEVLREKREQEARERAQQAELMQAKHRQTMAELDAELADRLGEDEYLSEDSDITEVPHCPVCDKTFKSLKAYENHEKSKLHLKRIEMFRLEIEAEEQAQAQREAKKKVKSNPATDIGEKVDSNNGDDNGTVTGSEDPLSSRQSEVDVVIARQQDDARDENVDEDEEDSAEAMLAALTNSNKGAKGKKQKKKKNVITMDELYQTLEDDVASTTAATASPAAKPVAVVADEDAAAEDVDLSVSSAPAAAAAKKKLTGKKAKEAREMRRHQREQGGVVEADIPEFQCGVCHAEFPTRNKLFSHISATGHAVLEDGRELHGGVGSEVKEDDDWDTDSRKKKKGGRR